MGVLMPTVFTHPAISLAIGLGLGRDVIPTSLLIAGIVVSGLPDLDVLAFRYGVSYASNFGHRGSLLSHLDGSVTLGVILVEPTFRITRFMLFVEYHNFACLSV